MSSAIVERTLEEVKKLTADERRDLREALAHEPPPSAHAFNTHEREHAWAERNREEYLNQWVALAGLETAMCLAGAAGSTECGSG